MKISRNKWHYRYIKWWIAIKRVGLISLNPVADPEGDMPKSLCTYFWTLVGCLTLFPLALGLTALGSYLVVGVWLFIVRPIVWFIKLFRRNKKDKKDEPSLVVSYVKAHKEKVCPLITYE